MSKAARIRAERRAARPFRAVPDPMIVATGVYSWESQAAQFDRLGEPGLEWRVEHSMSRPINCYLVRGEDGRLEGIGYHYPVDMGVLEKAGNVNIWVRPDRQRQGIATNLLHFIETHLGSVNFSQQRYSVAGARLVNKYLDSQREGER